MSTSITNTTMIEYVVQVLCYNRSFSESVIYNGFLYDRERKYVITSGHVAGYMNYMVLLQGQARNAAVCKVGNMDLAILRLDSPYAKPKRVIPSVIDIAVVGDHILIADYSGGIDVQVISVQPGCVFASKKGYPGSPVFKNGNGRFIGLVRGNGENILPAAMIDQFLLS